MNKFFISMSVAVLLTTYVNAQTSSGNMMVGGSIDFNSQSRQGGQNNFNSFTFSPSFGYFVIDNLVVGTSLTLGSTRTGTGNGKSVSTNFGLGPFARYYKFTSNENFAIFGQAGLTFASGKTDPAVGGITKNSSVSFSLAPGAAFFFNEHWALELSLTGFVISSIDPDKDDNNDKVTRVDFSLRSLSPSLGVRYHF